MIKQRFIEKDHGSGGLLSRYLIDNVIVPSLASVYLGEMEDSGIAPFEGNKIAMTTDSFVIDPIFYGNGDIGKLAICGTVNDIAVSGAICKYLTLALILEEGFAIDDLKVILDSACSAARDANVKIIAGDTKVVGKGDVDKIYINTAGVGIFPENQKPLKMKNINEGDHIIVTGHLGNHGIHILSLRDGLGFDEKVLSDCAPLNKVIQEILANFHDDIHYMRDLTRGGLGCILNEILEDIKLTAQLDEASIPLQDETTMAAEMLGINPMYLANEGNICIFCSPHISQDLVSLLKKHEYTKNAKVCGVVTKLQEAHVLLKTTNGSTSIINHPEWLMLPRLC